MFAHPILQLFQKNVCRMKLLNALWYIMITDAIPCHSSDADKPVDFWFGGAAPDPPHLSRPGCLHDYDKEYGRCKLI